eukprot:scaffold19052_cov117-Isochrysis_galbana.AAC.6
MATIMLVESLLEVRWPSGKAFDCRSNNPEFESRSHLLYHGMLHLPPCPLPTLPPFHVLPASCFDELVACCMLHGAPAALEATERVWEYDCAVGRCRPHNGCRNLQATSCPRKGYGKAPTRYSASSVMCRIEG